MKFTLPSIALVSLQLRGSKPKGLAAAVELRQPQLECACVRRAAGSIWNSVSGH